MRMYLNNGHGLSGPAIDQMIIEGITEVVWRGDQFDISFESGSRAEEVQAETGWEYGCGDYSLIASLCGKAIQVTHTDDNGDTCVTEFAEFELEA